MSGPSPEPSTKHSPQASSESAPNEARLPASEISKARVAALELLGLTKENPAKWAGLSLGSERWDDLVTRKANLKLGDLLRLHEMSQDLRAADEAKLLTAGLELLAPNSIGAMGCLGNAKRESRLNKGFKCQADDQVAIRVVLRTAVINALGKAGLFTEFYASGSEADLPFDQLAPQIIDRRKINLGIYDFLSLLSDKEANFVMRLCGLRSRRKIRFPTEQNFETHGLSPQAERQIFAMKLSKESLEDPAQILIRREAAERFFTAHIQKPRPSSPSDMLRIAQSIDVTVSQLNDIFGGALGTRKDRMTKFFDRHAMNRLANHKFEAVDAVLFIAPLKRAEFLAAHLAEATASSEIEKLLGRYRNFAKGDQRANAELIEHLVPGWELLRIAKAAKLETKSQAELPTAPTPETPQNKPEKISAAQVAAISERTTKKRAQYTPEKIAEAKKLGAFYLLPPELLLEWVTKWGLENCLYRLAMSESKNIQVLNAESAIAYVGTRPELAELIYLTLSPDERWKFKVIDLPKIRKAAFSYEVLASALIRLRALKP